MADIRRITVVLLLLLLVAGVVYAERNITLNGGDAIGVTCGGKYYPVVNHTGNIVYIRCEPMPIFPMSTARPEANYLPAVLDG